MSLAPWWAAANAEPPADEFKRDRAAATTSHNIECQLAIDAMRRTAQAEMLKLLDEMPAASMARA